jgi:hypothetical protein
MRVGTVGLVLALALGACTSEATRGGGTDDSLSDDELAFARAIVQDEASVKGTDISSATAIVRSGTVTDSNVGQPCTSGRLLAVKLIGKFPHIVTTGHPVRRGEHVDFTVTAVVITADAETGQVCLKGVQTGDVEPEHGAQVIPLD